MILVISTLDEKPADRLFFGQLAGAAKAAGHSLVKWSDFPNPGSADAHLPMPYYLNKLIAFFRPRPQAQQAAAKVLDLDLWTARHKVIKKDPSSSMTDHQAVSAFAGIALSVLEALKPDLVLLVNPLVPHTGIPKALCKYLGIPTLTFERGFFKASYFIETGGVFGHSVLAGRSLADLTSDNADLTPLTITGREYLASLNPSSMNRRPAKTTTTNLPKTVESDTLKVAVLGTDDSTMGIFPAHHPDRRLQYPFFEDSATLAKLVAENLQNPQWANFRNGEKKPLPVAVVFKPHPIAAHLIPEGENGYTIYKGDLMDVMAWADVVVTNGSSTEFIACMMDKPLVLCGGSILRGKGIGHEVTLARQLPEKIWKASQRQNQAARKENFETLVGYLLAEYLIFPQKPIPQARQVQAVTTEIFTTYTPDPPQPQKLDQLPKLLHQKNFAYLWYKARKSAEAVKKGWQAS